MKYFSITLAVILLPLICLAAPPTTAEINDYIDTKWTQAAAHSPNSYTSQGSMPAQLPYQGGNNPVLLALKMVGDFFGHIDDFYSGGMRFSIVGLCKKGISIFPYIEYYYPYEMWEASGIYQGQYTTRATMKLYEEINSVLWYPDAENAIPDEVERAGQLAWGSSPGSTNASALSATLSALQGHVAQSRGDHRALSHDIQRQYTYFAPLTQPARFPITPLGICHDPVPPTFSVRSDSPLDILATHMTGISDVLFPAEMAVMRAQPGTCLGHNVFKQVTPANPFQSFALPAEQKDLCITALGSHFPITVRMTNTRSFYNAARLSFLRGDNFFKHGVQNPFKQDFHYYKDPAVQSPHIDYMQYHFPPGWPGGYSNKIGDDADFRSNGYRPEIHQPDPLRAVATVWKYIRCCVQGKPWIGPKPEREGLHLHSKQRLS